MAWITERKDVLSGLFGLLTLAAYVWYVRRPGLLRYLLVAAALALGLMAKPVLVTWPFLLLLLDYWPLGRMRKGRKGEREKGSRGEGEKGSISLSPFPPFSLSLLIVEKIPLLLLSAGSAAVTFLAQRSSGAVVSLESTSIGSRLAHAAILYVDYLGMTLWPVNLAIVYPRGPMESYGPAVAAGVLLALLTAGAVWGAWRGHRWLAVGWFWYLGTLVPNIGLVPVGFQVTADRFLYLPQIGLCIAVVWGVGSRGERGKGGKGAGEKGRKGEREKGSGEQGRISLSPSTRCAGAPPFSLSFLSALLLAALAVCAWRQASYWRDSESLWLRALACTSHDPAAKTNNGLAFLYNSVGATLAERGQLDAAIVQYHKALECQPEYEDAYLSLGLAFAARKQVNEAIAYYHRALEIRPDYPEVHVNLGAALAGRGWNKEAMLHYRKALQVKPNYAEAHIDLGAALAAEGRLDEALGHFQQALEIRPDYAEAHKRLGAALAAGGRIDEAIVHFQKAVDLTPDSADGPRQPRRGPGHARTPRRGPCPLPDGPGPGHRPQRPGPGRRYPRPDPTTPAQRFDRKMPVSTQGSRKIKEALRRVWGRLWCGRPGCPKGWGKGRQAGRLHHKHGGEP